MSQTAPDQTAPLCGLLAPPGSLVQQLSLPLAVAQTPKSNHHKNLLSLCSKEEGGVVGGDRCWSHHRGEHRVRLLRPGEEQEGRGPWREGRVTRLSFVISVCHTNDQTLFTLHYKKLFCFFCTLQRYLAQSLHYIYSTYLKYHPRGENWTFRVSDIQDGRHS